MSSRTVELFNCVAFLTNQKRVKSRYFTRYSFYQKFLKKILVMKLNSWVF